MDSFDELVDSQNSHSESVKPEIQSPNNKSKQNQKTESSSPETIHQEISHHHTKEIRHSSEKSPPSNFSHHFPTPISFRPHQDSQSSTFHPNFRQEFPTSHKIPAVSPPTTHLHIPAETQLYQQQPPQEEENEEGEEEEICVGTSSGGFFASVNGSDKFEKAEAVICENKPGKFVEKKDIHHGKENSGKRVCDLETLLNSESDGFDSKDSFASAPVSDSDSFLAHPPQNHIHLPPQNHASPPNSDCIKIPFQKPALQVPAFENPVFLYDPSFDPNRKRKPLEPWIYKPNGLIPYLGDNIDDCIKVIISGKYLTFHNERIRDRQLWGTDVYTDDSDIVACVAHSGKFSLFNKVPEIDLQVILRIRPAMNHYVGSLRKSLKSRKWIQQHDRCSIVVEKVERIKISNLAPRKSAAELFVRDMKKARLNSQKRNVAYMRQFTSTECGQHIDEVSISYNLTHEPVLKYTVNFLSDRGTSMKYWTSYKFKTSVLFLETVSDRYEISLHRCNPLDACDCDDADDADDIDVDGDGETRSHRKELVPHKRKKSTCPVFETYRFAKCISIQEKSLYKSQAGLLPLSLDSVHVVYSSLDWSEFVFHPHCVFVKGCPYTILRFFWCDIV